MGEGASEEDRAPLGGTAHQGAWIHAQVDVPFPPRRVDRVREDCFHRRRRGDVAAAAGKPGAPCDVGVSEGEQGAFYYEMRSIPPEEFPAEHRCGRGHVERLHGVDAWDLHEPIAGRSDCRLNPVLFAPKNERHRA